MARTINRLTAKSVASKKEPGLYADGAGLYLKVDSGGAKRWTFIFRFDGARREMGLGTAGVVDLAEAREKAKAARKLVSEKVNPIEARREADREPEPPPEVQTFKEFAKGLVAGMSKRPATLRLWNRTVDLHLGALADMDPAAIDTDAVLEMLKALWTDRPHAARNARIHIEHFLDAAKVAGLRTGENPARWKGHLKLLLPPIPRLVHGHYAALPPKRMRELYPHLVDQKGVCAQAIRFTILTVCRKNEAAGAEWAEIDVDKAIWTIPAERMKSGREHRVALSKAALGVLEEVKASRDIGPYVFPGGRNGNGTLPVTDRGMTSSLNRIEGFDCTMHGFRSTFRDWVDDHTKFSGDLAEHALSHAVGSLTERAYKRGDMLAKRYALMDAWAKWCGA